MDQISGYRTAGRSAIWPLQTLSDGAFMILTDAAKAFRNGLLHINIAVRFRVMTAASLRRQISRKYWEIPSFNPCKEHRHPPCFIRKIVTLIGAFFLPLSDFPDTPSIL